VAGAAAVAAVASAAEVERVYLANDDHTDYMWTADAGTYSDVFVDLIDYNLHLADLTANNPPAFRARFNTDGNFWLWNYERKKSPADFSRLMERIKDGTIGSPLNTLVSCYGGQPVEAVLRGMYYAGRLERRYDLRFRLANATENQTLPLGLASLFAGAGADYTWRGVCGCATRLDKKDLGERPREMYWYAGHDGQRLLMKWYSTGPHNIGTYGEADEPVAAIKYLESDPGFIRRYVDPHSRERYYVLGIFGFGHDNLARKTGIAPPPEIPGVPGLHKVISSPYSDHFHVIAQQQTTAQRQVIVSNELDFFQDFAARYAASLDTQTVTYGNEWDLYSASMVETSARVKRAVEKLRAAELLSTLVSLRYPRFMANHVAARDEAFTDLGLYWEHDWTADGPLSRGERAAWQEMIASTIEYYVESIQAEGLIRLGGLIPNPEKARRFFVLNPLGWPRTDYADFPYSGSPDVHVQDLVAGQEVPSQRVNLNGATYLRILAPDVPSAGYKVFEILPGASAPTSPAAATSAGNTVIENAAFKLVLSRDGALHSLIDKRAESADLAATIGGLALNDLAPYSDDGDALEVINAGPVSVTVRAHSRAGLEHTTEVTLYRGVDRIEIRNEITQNFSDVRYWSFGFNLAAPAVHTEEVGALNLNKLQSEGGDYANTHARYDHITVNHFADITAGDNQHGVTLSNPDLAFARLGTSTVAKLDSTTPQLNLLAGGQVDGRSLGIYDQNGAHSFLQRFALRPHGAYDPVAAMRFALEHQNPLVAAEVLDKGTNDYPETRFSLLTVSDPRVLLWAVKPAEEGIEHGVVARLWNVSDAPATTKVGLFTPLAQAKRSTHLETDLENAEVTSEGELLARFSRQQLQTFRLIRK
jgi:alpha-mannosidase